MRNANLSHWLIRILYNIRMFLFRLPLRGHLNLLILTGLRKAIEFSL